MEAEYNGDRIVMSKEVFNMVVEYHRQFGMIKELPTEQEDRVSYVKAFWNRLVLKNPYFPHEFNCQLVAGMFFEDVIVGNVPNIFPNLRSQISAFRVWYGFHKEQIAIEHEKAFPSERKQIAERASRITPIGCLDITREELISSIEALKMLKKNDWANLLDKAPTYYYKELVKTAKYYGVKI